MRIPVVLAVAVAAVCACKGKPTNNQQAGSGAVKNGSATMGALVPNKGSDIAPDIVLPHSDGSPPIKTTVPITTDKLTALSQLQFPGFLRDVRKADTMLDVRHKTDSRPRIMASVMIEACGTTCTAMDLAQWKAKGDALKEFLAKGLREAPDTQFDVGETTVNGAKAIYTTQLAQKIERGSDGNTSGGFSYTYGLYYNDGVNQIHVIAAYNDDPMATKEDMVKAVPRGDLEKVAKAFLDIYTHKW